MKLNVRYNNLLDIINLNFGVYYPLNEFVSKENFLSIVKKIRDQVRYESLDKLKKQIKIDINNIFQILKSKKYE